MNDRVESSAALTGAPRLVWRVRALLELIASAQGVGVDTEQALRTAVSLLDDIDTLGGLATDEPPLTTKEIVSEFGISEADALRLLAARESAEMIGEL